MKKLFALVIALLLCFIDFIVPFFPIGSILLVAVAFHGETRRVVQGWLTALDNEG